MKISAPRTVVPGIGLPADFAAGNSNNNLDVVRHDGRLWLAFRTAPTHYASASARLCVVVSDDDGLTWSLDHTIAPGRDVREPRLVSWNQTLLFYWFTAGTSGTKFEPDRIWVAERGHGGWSESVAISPPDCVVWRVRPIGGRLHMSLYRGAGALYTASPEPLTVELWVSDDGRDWTPVDPAEPVVHRGGVETDFVELADGRVVTVVRKEGPEGGWGSDIGVGEAAEPHRWRLRHDPRKFDSPLLFVSAGQTYLVTRRQVAFGGRYDLGLRWLPDGLRTKVNMVIYALTPKRTAIYRIDPDELTATWLADLPSAGDTAFAGQVSCLDGDGQLIFNYSSPVNRGWWPWMIGQLRPTHIYCVKVSGLAE